MTSMLTFDDGPGPSTARLLDVLRDAGCTATFFVLGMHAQARRPLLARMVEEGHAIGNHGWTHARDVDLSDAQFEHGLAATDRVIHDVFDALGIARPAAVPVRLPYGPRAGDTRLRVIERLGRPHVGWTALFDDWVRPAPDPARLAEAMRAHVAHQARRGEDAVLCLHDGSPRDEAREATVEAVARWLALPSGGRLQGVPAAEESHRGPGHP